jgi:uncharacterized membrane protein YcaP (DUF421 family)
VIERWFKTSATELWLIVVSSVAIYGGVITAVRLNGPRSLSKMSSFDFAVTVAIGSLIASVAATTTSLLNGLIALAAIVASQRVVAVARRRSGIEQLIDNAPILLMRDGVMLEQQRLGPG